MIKHFFLIVVMLVSALSASAQSLATAYKTVGNANPISGSVFCADPTALDYEGRLYVYGSNDHQQFIKNGKKGENSYGAIKSLVVFSTDDMVNWTFHGTIDVAKLCSSWGWQFGNSWAPSVTWRSGKYRDEFFLYFANGASNIGVLTASSPTGPWSSPKSGPMITGSTSGVSPCNWCFDPGVVIDENGQGWISFGGGDPNGQGSDLQPNNACIAKLKSTMTAIDGSAVKLPAPYHFEASELNIIGGKFVYTYCSSWKDRNAWSTYQQQQGITVSTPGKCTMCYMVSDDPTEPSSWKYKGVYGPHASAPNNHSHLHKFNGKYYHIYHSADLLNSMKSKGGVDGSASTFRSICVNAATVTESTPKINTVTLNQSGVAAIKNFDPYVLQQAETMATSGGVNYEDFKNLSANTDISGLGNDASRNMTVKMAQGAWTVVRNVDFGTSGATSVTLRVKGKGTLEVRVGSRTSASVAVVENTTTSLKTYTVDVDPTKCVDVKNLYFVSTGENAIQFDQWQFSDEVPDAINVPFIDASSETSSPKYYDFGGRQLKGLPTEGFFIDENGKKFWRK